MESLVGGFYSFKFEKRDYPPTPSFSYQLFLNTAGGPGRWEKRVRSEYVTGEGGGPLLLRKAHSFIIKQLCICVEKEKEKST